MLWVQGYLVRAAWSDTRRRPSGRTAGAPANVPVLFGLGSLQFTLCALAVMAAALAWNAPRGTAAVVGLALSMSSTAVVVQVLSHEKRLGLGAARS